MRKTYEKNLLKNLYFATQNSENMTLHNRPWRDLD